jgi:HSP20 family protein
MATRNSGRSEDRNSGRGEDRSGSRSASGAGGNSARRDSAASAQSGGSRQNSGGTSAAAASGGTAGGTTGNTGIGGLGGSSANATNTATGAESRSSSGQSSGSSGARSDQERQLRTSREQGGSRTSQSNRGQSQQGQEQGRPYATPAYFSGSSPFAMMRRMMDDMDRLFSDFGFVQPGLLASSLFGSDAWGNPESSRALGGGQPSSSQHPALSGQRSSQQGLQRSNQSGMQSWSQGLWSPQVEVRERGNNIVVRADLPGLSRDDVDIEIDNDSLIIRGERHNDWEDEQEGYYRSERSYGTFYRAIPLPDGIDPNACNATFKDGVLEVTLPRPAENQSRGRKIQVK